MFSAALHSLATMPRDLKQWRRLLDGARQFRETGITPDRAYQALIKLYCRTNGHANDLMHALISRRFPAVPLTVADGVLGTLDDAGTSGIVDTLRKDGFVVFPNALSAEVCDRLAEFARASEAALYPVPQGGPDRAVYDSENPLSAGYWFDERTVVSSPDVQRLMADTSVLRVVQEYLGCEPIMDIVGMWWSVAASKRTSDEERNELAQLYHFDMNRIKWLKVMIYLTDVGADGGPHCFIRGTHRAGSQPADILKSGYVRFTDEDLARHYAAEDMVEIVGGRGTILIDDTRGLHKGKTPENADRLVFQLNFCDSLFGAPVERTNLPADCDDGLRELMDGHPRIFERFRIQEAV